MARFDILGLQYFTDGGELLGSGKLNFYETGTTTRKTTYSDAGMTIANTNPVTLDADGRAPNIFFAGLAKCVLTDSTGVVLETKDPVGDDSADQNGFPDWAADVTYSFNQPVTGSDGYIYTSLVNNNIGNDPISSPTDWQLLAKTIGFDDANNGYVYVVDTAEPLKINAVPKSTLQTLIPIVTTTASNVAAVDFTNLSSDYAEYQIHILNAIPATDAVSFYIRTSSNNGVSFDSGGADYAFGVTYGSLNGAQAEGTNGAAQIRLSHSAYQVGSAANENGVVATLTLSRPSDAAYTMMSFNGAYVEQAGALYSFSGGGERRASAAVDAIRFFFDTGNVESGIFTLYGVSRT